MDTVATELVPERDDAYESFVVGHPHSLFNHSVRYRNLLVGLLGCVARYGVAVRDGDIVGVLPLMEREGPYGTIVNSLPYFGSCAGILATDERSSAVLREWYEEVSSRNDVAASTVIENPLTLPAVPMPYDATDERVGHITLLDRSGSPTEPASPLISGSALRNVRKALSSGVVVEVDNDAFEVLEELHLAGMAAIGGLAKSHEFFRSVREGLRAGVDYNLYIASVRDTIVAALLVFYYRGIVEYWVPATKLAFRHLQPMAAILQKAMADAVERDCRLWNWGGCWLSQESLVRFKVKWGGQPKRYRYWVKVNNSELFSATPSELLDAYPGFYVLPFALLTKSEGDHHCDPPGGVQATS